MAGKLTGNAGGTFSRGEIVNRADVVEATTCNVVPTRGIGASHDPRGSKRYGVDFVGCIRIPDDQLAILGG